MSTISDPITIDQVYPSTVTSAALLLGAGTSTTPQLTSTAGKNFVGFWCKSTATSGDARAMYMRLYLTGASGGEAIRAYTTAQGTVGVGGTVNGLHASLSVDASAAVSGQGNAARFTLDLAADTRTAGANLACVTLDSNFGTGNTIGTGAAFIRVTDLTAVKMPALLNIPAASNGTIFATHTVQTMSHSIRCVDAAGTAYYIMCTNSASNRG
jgi:hypothetical protein